MLIATEPNGVEAAAGGILVAPSADEIRREVLGSGELASRLDNRFTGAPLGPIAPAGEGLQRIAEVPIYSADPLVRRSPPLQHTPHAAPPVAWVSPALYERLGLNPGDALRVRQEHGERLAAARPETAHLGAMLGPITAERVAGQQKAIA